MFLLLITFPTFLLSHHFSSSHTILSPPPLYSKSGFLFNLSTLFLNFAYFNSHIFPLLFFSQYFSACTIDYEQKTQTCKGSSALECNQMTKEEREEKRKKNPAANEVLSEIHNAVCTALKDFSRGRCFSLWAPAEVRPGRVGVLVMRPPLLG